MAAWISGSGGEKGGQNELGGYDQMAEWVSQKYVPKWKCILLHKNCCGCLYVSNELYFVTGMFSAGVVLEAVLLQ